MQEIVPGVFIETSYALVTVGAVLTNAGWVCIDTPPYPRDARSWVMQLQAISPDSPILYVINTDHHRDRILGNVWFDAPVVTHSLAATYMLGLSGNFISQAADEMSSNDSELVELGSLKVVPPQLSYDRVMYLYCGDEEVILTNRPSAMFSSTWVTFPQRKTIFVGDTVSVSQHPYISDGATKSWLNILRSLRTEQRYVGWNIVSGREGIVRPADTEPLSEYLRVARRRINSLLHAERPRSEIGQLIAEFLPLFPYDPTHREKIQRRIKAGLEAIYEEIRDSRQEEVE